MTRPKPFEQLSREQKVRRAMKELVVGKCVWMSDSELHLVKHVIKLSERQRHGKRFRVQQDNAGHLIVSRTA